MKTELFDYHLPPEKIAQHPIEPRDSSKLLVISQEKEKEKERNFFQEMIFRDITSLLRPRDILVINDTRVMPARIRGITYLESNKREKIKEKREGLKIKDVECLFLRNTAPDIWEIMCFP